MSLDGLSPQARGSAGATELPSLPTRSRAERQTPSTLVSKPRLDESFIAKRRRREVQEAQSDEKSCFDTIAYTRNRRSDSISSIETIRPELPSDTHMNSCSFDGNPPISPQSPLMDIVDTSWPIPPKMTETIECSILRNLEKKPSAGPDTAPLNSCKSTIQNQKMGPVRPSRRTRTEPIRSGSLLAARSAKLPALCRRTTDSSLQVKTGPASSSAVALTAPTRPVDTLIAHANASEEFTSEGGEPLIVVPAEKTKHDCGELSPVISDLQATVVRIVLLSEHLTVWDCPEDSFILCPAQIQVSREDGRYLAAPHASKINISFSSRGFRNKHQRLPSYSISFQGDVVNPQRKLSTNGITIDHHWLPVEYHNAWFLDLWIPIPISLFRKAETRSFQIQANLILERRSKDTIRSRPFKAVSKVMTMSHLTLGKSASTTFTIGL